MKKVKVLLIVNIIQIVLLIGSIVAMIFVLPNVMLFSNTKIPSVVVMGTTEDVHNGYAQVTTYGAIPNDNKDDTNAFKKALQTNASIYIPDGVYDIDETVVIEDKNIKGSGSGRTIIRSAASDYAISAKGNCVIEELGIEFSNLSGNEKTGEKVAIFDNGLTNGSMVKSVAFKNIGTGFLSSADKNGAFCTTIEAVTFDDYSYKAIDIKSGLSTVLRSVTIGKGKTDKLIPVTLGGVVTVESVTFNDTVCEYAIELNNSLSAILRSVIFNKTNATSSNFVLCDSARFAMHTVTLIESTGENLICVADEKGSTTKSGGSVLMIYSNGKDINVSNDKTITCDAILK